MGARICTLTYSQGRGSDSSGSASMRASVANSRTPANKQTGRIRNHLCSTDAQRCQRVQVKYARAMAQTAAHIRMASAAASAVYLLTQPWQPYPGSAFIKGFSVAALAWVAYREASG